MWAAAAVLLFCGLVACHLWWRHRFRQLDLESAHQRTDARRLEDECREELQRDRARQEAVFNSMTEGLLVLDSDGRVRLVNRSLERLFGLSEDIRGRTLLEALRRHEVQELVERARAEGQALGLEIEVPGETPRHLEVNASTFNDRGSERRVVILVFHDVTRLKELEDTRRELVANVSHELRTPLALIKGFVQTLIDGARHDPQVSLRFLHTIEKHADRLTFLIEDLLTISQLESGQVVLNRQWAQLRPLAEHVLEDLTARAGGKQVTLHNQIPEDLHLRVDADRLQQVLFNLVDNAIKYGRQGGHVRLTAQVNPSRQCIEVCVQDDGPGIPPEAIDRIFERFYRVDAARSREQGGTGLGLSIVKHIVHAHAGQVRAESDPGKGATFRFTLPWEPPPASVR